MKKLTVTLAKESPDEIKNTIVDGFRSMVGEVEPEFRYDNSLIGGFTAACDGKFWDMSVRTQLRKITAHMESEG